jgi:hypothetical protein
MSIPRQVMGVMCGKISIYASLRPILRRFHVTGIIVLRLIITIGAISAAIAHMLWPKFVPDAITAGLLFLAILPWLAPIIKSIEVPGVGKLELQVQEVRQRQDRLQEEIEKTRSRIDNLVIASMSPLALQNLRKIASGNFGSFYRGQGLTWQLLHFASIGYISFKCQGIDQIPTNGEEPVKLNLSDYTAITQLGLEYLALREIIEKQQLNSKV